jgi:hypothetical protein
VTFVVDLQPYEILIEKLRKDLVTVNQMMTHILDAYASDEHTGYERRFRKFQRELEMLADTFNGTTLKFSQVRQLRGRNKRSLIPFVGSALNFLFGTVTDADLRKVQRNIRVLAENQRTIQHVMEDSLTILNTTRVEVSENRETINVLLKDVQLFENEVRKLFHTVSNKINEIEFFLSTYFRMNLVIDETRQFIQKLVSSVEYLNLKLNMLSLGHLSPSTITPVNLRTLLQDIQIQIFPNLKLPADPVKDLWKFYQLLQCTTIWEDDKIIVLVPVPLLEVNNVLEVFEVINLPLPLPQATAEHKRLTASYVLEAKALAVDAKRSRFVLLDELEFRMCSRPLIGFCDFKSPLYPVNLNNFCIISLFLNDADSIHLNCQTEVKFDSVIPMAKYISDGTWAISSHEPIKLNIICPKQNGLHTYAKPPLSLIKLDMSCLASSDHMTLTPYYRDESTFPVDNDLTDSILDYVQSNDTLWRPFQKILGSTKNLTLPSKLTSMRQIPMNHLITQLREMGRVTVTKDWTFHDYFILAGVAIALIGVLGVILSLYVWKKKRLGGLRPNARWSKDDTEATEPGLGSATAANSDHATDVGEETSSSTPMLLRHQMTATVDAANPPRVKFFPGFARDER